MFEARDIIVRYGQTTVLDGVSLTVRAGELLALCGPNGAGKSTLLAAFAGDLVPGRGEVLLDGRSLRSLTPAELAAKRAVLEQHPTLTAPFTVRDLLLLSIPREVPQGHADDLIHTTLAAVGLSDRIDDNCLILSGGQRHRAHLARVLVQLGASQEARNYLLLDEPTASLDMAHQISTLRTAREAARAGIGVLVVLHDLNLAAAYADRLVLMQHGRIVDEGAPDRVLTAEGLSAMYETEIAVERIDGRPPRIVPIYE